MALDRLTKVDGGGISTTSDYRVGVITATKFVGPVEGSLTGAINATSANFTGNVTIGGTLTYEDVTNIDSIGLGTFRNGIHVKTGTATTALVVEGDGRVTGILTIGTSSLTLDGTNNLVNVGTALTLGHTQGVQFHTQNLHSQGFEVNNINASGIITAAQFSGDGSNLANLPAGLGTALSSTQSSPLNKIYYTNSVLPIDTTTTVDPPASASAAYTQYTDISIATGADLIISDGDDLIPDVLGLRPDGTLGGGSLGRIRVDKLVGKNANSAVNVEKGLVITGITTIKNTGGIKLYEGSGNGSKLFHSGVERLSTELYGIDINGTLGADQINCSGIVTATAFVPSQGQLSHRNIAINGDMRVAQRGSSSTTSGYATVDRFKVSYSGTDEAPTQAQVDVASGTTPYTLGFRKALKITNGDQTGGAGAADFITYAYRVEAQDMASSGWNYTSASSFITLSFWIKSSVAQSFGCFLRSHDGNQLTFPFETGSLSPDTWTKIIKIIPGNGAMSFSYDNGTGLEIIIGGFWGTDYTTSNKPLDTWGAYSNSSRLRDNTSTWYTTNDSTLEITGLQLEVGSVATPFEHRSYGDEFLRCARYYYKQTGVSVEMLLSRTGGRRVANVYFPVPMRAIPNVTINTAFTDGGASISPSSVSIHHYKAIQASSSAGGAAPNFSDWEANAEL